MIFGITESKRSLEKASDEAVRIAQMYMDIALELFKKYEITNNMLFKMASDANIIISENYRKAAENNLSLLKNLSAR